MKKNILILLLASFSHNLFACVNLSGTYADKVTTLQITQNKCEELIQTVKNWYIAKDVSTKYVLDGKEYVDSNYATAKGNFAFVKSRIDENEMQANFRRGNPNVEEKIFVKKFTKDSKGSLVINTFEIQNGKEIHKEKWILPKK